MYLSKHVFIAVTLLYPAKGNSEYCSLKFEHKPTKHTALTKFILTKAHKYLVFFSFLNTSNQMFMALQ